MQALALTTLVAALAAQIAAAQAPLRPFPQHVLYAPGKTKPNPVSQLQLDNDARALYTAWKSRYVVQMGTEPDGHPRYRVRAGRQASDPTVSEGQGYGLMLAALFAGYDANAQILFDGLWEFALDHASSIDARLMDWYVPANEGSDPNGDDSAFDGDCDAAFALLLAEEQWGNGGRFDYHAEAARVLAGVLQSTIGPQSRLPMLGDWVDPNDVTYNQFAPRASDLMLDHFRAFQRWSGSASWGQVTSASTACATAIVRHFSLSTALLPDFIVPTSPTNTTPKPAPPNYLEGPYDGDYSYNSCRVPWRLATDALINGNGLVLRVVRRNVMWLHNATAANPNAIRAGYHLNGSPLPGSNYFTTAFAAPFAVAAMTQPSEQTFLNALYDSVKASDEDYYEDSLSLLCMLVLTGNWWDPTLP
jgi:endo-1,4-beta-D-glucanase Y